MTRPSARLCLRASEHSRSRTGSSSQWLARQARDPYVRARGGEGEAYVARSAFKLLELQQRTKLLRPGMTVVDLGGAPGGWSQVASSLVVKPSDGKQVGIVVAMDLLPLARQVSELPGVTSIQGDFLLASNQARLVEALRATGREPTVDVVLSDMLANMSGNPLRDSQQSVDLCEAVLSFALAHLRRDASTPTPIDSDASTMSTHKSARGRGGKVSPPSLVMKCLQSDLANEFVSETLRKHFRSVKWDKPASSRPQSRESYLLCSGLKATL